MRVLPRLRAGLLIGLVSAVLWGAGVAFIRLAELLFTNTTDRPDHLLAHLFEVFVIWLPVGFASGLACAVLLVVFSRALAGRAISAVKAAAFGMGGGSIGFLVLSTLIWGRGLQEGINSYLLLQMGAFGAVGSVASLIIVGVAQRGQLSESKPEPDALSA
jgi:hypothetical protein